VALNLSGVGATGPETYCEVPLIINNGKMNMQNETRI